MFQLLVDITNLVEYLPSVVIRLLLRTVRNRRAPKLTRARNICFALGSSLAKLLCAKSVQLKLASLGLAYALSLDYFVLGVMIKTY